MTNKPPVQKVLQAAELELKPAERKNTPGRPGPTTGDLDTNGRPRPQTAIAYLTQNATAAELDRFAATVRRRKAKEPTVRHWKCNRCGFVGAFAYAMTPTNCSICNWQNLQNGGRMVEMTAAEVDQWKVDQAAATAKAIDRARQSAWIKDNAARAAAGVPPRTLAAFTDEQNRSYRAMCERDRRLSASSSQVRW